VAEVVRYSKPDLEEGSHKWMLGTVNWNGRQLPVVSYEGVLGKDIPVATGRTRIVVFLAITGQLKAGYFGVLTQGFPQLVRVNRDVLKLDATEGWPADAPVLCRVKMINEYPLIPDLEKLELMLARESLQA
jgi:chemosensory pili system protein ChpC